MITFNILGVNEGDSQILTFTFTTTDQQTITATSDLTSQFTSFNDNMSPVALSGGLDIPTDLEADGITIGGWEESDIDLNGTAK